MYYRDEIEKLKYLRNRISSTLVLNGMLPDRDIIDKRLDSIDTKLALFQHTYVSESSQMDVHSFNQGLLAIYEDLRILYSLVHEFSVKNLEETKAYAEMHLSELESLASRYEQKTRLETGSTSIGDTILFQSNGFNISTKNCVTTVDLGNIKVNRGSKVSFLIHGSGFQEEDAVFVLNNQECMPYSANGDYLVIPGRAGHQTYLCSFPDDVEPADKMVLVSQGLVPNMANNYVIYGGKDTVRIKERYGERYEKKEDLSPITLNDIQGRVSFYIVDGSYINFDFSSKPVSQNFSGYALDGLQQKQKITFEYQGPFAFNYVTDGKVYAVRNYGIVKEQNLMYPDDVNLNDFLVEEYTGEDAVELPLYIRIQQESEDTPMITMVAVKELSVLNEEETV